MGSTQVFLLCGDFSFVLVSNVAGDAKPEEILLVFKILLLITFFLSYVFVRSAFCRASPFLY